MIRVVLLVKHAALAPLETALAQAAEAAFARASAPLGVPEVSGVEGAALISLALDPVDYATIQLYTLLEEVLGKDAPAFSPTEFAISNV